MEGSNGFCNIIYVCDLYVCKLWDSVSFYEEQKVNCLKKEPDVHNSSHELLSQLWNETLSALHKTLML